MVPDGVEDSDERDTAGGGGCQGPAYGHGPARVDIGPGRPLVVELGILDDTHQEDGLKRTVQFIIYTPQWRCTWQHSIDQ